MVSGKKLLRGVLKPAAQACYYVLSQYIENLIAANPQSSGPLYVAHHLDAEQLEQTRQELNPIWADLLNRMTKKIKAKQCKA